MFLLLACFAFAASTPPSSPTWGVGYLSQGLRPGVVVERALPLHTRTNKKGRSSTLLFLPTVSGWVHPGHYVPVQLHAHLADQSGDKWFVESSLGVGATYAFNGRKTVAIEDDELKTRSLAGGLVASPALGFAVGKRGSKTESLLRVRLAGWVGWQHRVSPSWNLEALVRF